jgi:hypothetical protein
MVCFLICRFRLVAFREHRAGLACGAEDVGEVLRISGTDGVMDGSREKMQSGGIHMVSCYVSLLVDLALFSGRGRLVMYFVGWY